MVLCSFNQVPNRHQIETEIPFHTCRQRSKPNRMKSYICETSFNLFCTSVGHCPKTAMKTSLITESADILCRYLLFLRCSINLQWPMSFLRKLFLLIIKQSFQRLRSYPSSIVPSAVLYRHTYELQFNRSSCVPALFLASLSAASPLFNPTCPVTQSIQILLCAPSVSNILFQG